MTRLFVCAVAGLVLAGCTSTVTRRPVGPMVSTQSTSEALFAPEHFGEPSLAMMGRRDAALSPRAEERPEDVGRSDLRGARRIRLSADPSTHTFFEPRRSGRTFEQY